MRYPKDLMLGALRLGSAPYVIAEIGNNHLGDVDLAHRTLDAAADAGVSAVKFQMIDPEKIVIGTEPLLQHVPDRETRTQRERFQKMSLRGEHFAALAEHARRRSVAFMCTPFDEASADYLEDLVRVYKVASGDVSNLRLLDHIAAKGKPMLVSTGMCTQDEIDALVKRLPADRLLLFHCIGAYPTPDAEVNMAIVPFLRQRYGLPIGFSDHTPDLLAPALAVGLGAVAIEKHFILDRSLPGGDRALSLVPEEMTELVKNLRRVVAMIGDSPRRLYDCEQYGRRKLRRSPYTSRAARAGETLDLNSIVFLRPCDERAFSVAEVMAATHVELLADFGPEELLTPANARLVQ